MSKESRKQLRKDVKDGWIKPGCNTVVGVPALFLAVLGLWKARRR